MVENEATDNRMFEFECDELINDRTIGRDDDDAIR